MLHALQKLIALTVGTLLALLQSNGKKQVSSEHGDSWSATASGVRVLHQTLRNAAMCFSHGCNLIVRVLTRHRHDAYTEDGLQHDRGFATQWCGAASNRTASTDGTRAVVSRGWKSTPPGQKHGSSPRDVKIDSAGPAASRSVPHKSGDCSTSSEKTGATSECSRSLFVTMLHLSLTSLTVCSLACVDSGIERAGEKMSAQLRVTWNLPLTVWEDGTCTSTYSSMGDSGRKNRLQTNGSPAPETHQSSTFDPSPTSERSPTSPSTSERRSPQKSSDPLRIWTKLFGR